MTRRFPPALGIIGVFTAVHGLAVLMPMVGSWFRAGGSLEWMFALLAVAAITQLCAGVAIATSWAHARIAVLAWTLVSIAAATFAGDLMAQDLSVQGLFVMYVEALAAPALAWLALVFAGEETPAPAIPHARVVSAPSSTESSVPSTSEATHDAANDARREATDATTDATIAARRPLVGVLLVGMSILGFVGIVLWHLPLLLFILRGDNVGAAFLGEGLLIGHAFAVACLALRAGRRLVDTNAPARHARNAMILYLAVDVGGDLVLFAIKMGYQLVTGDLDGEMRNMIYSQWIASAVLGLVVPTFLWFYVSTALRGTRSPDEAPAPNLAALPAWAMLWFAPFLLARVLVDLEADGLFSPGILKAVVVISGVLGVLYAMAGSRALRPSSASSTRVAYIAATISLVIACGFVIVWCIAMVAMDPFDRIRNQMPTAPLAQLVACGATMVWALQRRGHASR
ncbi:MAG: hypothetical protein ACKV2T_19260 [Kofleriaceae bacterium]